MRSPLTTDEKNSSRRGFEAPLRTLDSARRIAAVLDSATSPLLTESIANRAAVGIDMATVLLTELQQRKYVKRIDDCWVAVR